MWFAGGAESGTVQEYSGMPLASSVTLSQGGERKAFLLWLEVTLHAAVRGSRAELEVFFQTHSELAVFYLHSSILSWLRVSQCFSVSLVYCSVASTK